MPVIQITDGRSALWQWDTGVKIRILGCCSVQQCHFPTAAGLIARDAVDHVCAVPDAALQTAGTLKVYAYSRNENGGVTMNEFALPVNARPKPADYIDPPDEYDNLQALAERVAPLIPGGGGSVTPEQIGAAVEEYLAENPVEGEPGPQGPPGADGSDATVTAENVTAALGYTPADKETVESLSEEIDGFINGTGTVYSGSVIQIESETSKVCEISSETSGKVTLVRQGKNFIPQIAAVETTSGITATPNADGSHTISGTATSTVWVNFATTAEPIYLPAGTYRVSAQGLVTGLSVELRNTSDGAYLATLTPANYDKAFTITEPTLARGYIRIGTNAGEVNTNVFILAEINESEAATEFEKFSAERIETAYPARFRTHDGINVLYDESGSQLSVKVIDSDNVYLEETDATLSQVGAAADAAIVGNAFATLKGDLLKSNGGTPQMYGAVGDGKADDTAAIQQCINNHDVVVLPVGEYKITTPLQITYGKTLIGHNRTASIIKCIGCDAVHFAQRASLITISGIMFTGDDSDHKCFVFNQQQNVTITDIAVNHFGGAFFCAHNFGYVGIVRIRDCEFLYGGSNCFEILNSSASQMNSWDIHGCEISRFTGNAFDVAAIRLSVIGCAIQYVKNGINIEPSLSTEVNADGHNTRAVTIMSNYFEGMQQSFVRIAPNYNSEHTYGAGFVDGLVIMSNYGYCNRAEGTTYPAIKFEAVGDDVYGKYAKYPHAESMLRNLFYACNYFETDHGKVLIDGGNILQRNAVIYADTTAGDCRLAIDNPDEGNKYYTMENMGNADVHSKYAVAVKKLWVRHAFANDNAVIGSNSATINAGGTFGLTFDNLGVVNVSFPVTIAEGASATLTIKGYLDSGAEVTTFSGSLSDVFDSTTGIATIDSAKFLTDVSTGTQYFSKRYVAYEINIAANGNTVTVGDMLLRHVFNQGTY